MSGRSWWAMQEYSVNACGKRAFQTRRAAKRAGTRIRSGGHLRPYLCGDCQRWHLGHLPLATAYGLLAADAVYENGGSS